MPDDTKLSELYDKGLAMRRAVLGGEYVDRSIANADAFTQPFQKLVTEWCWGEIWNRPGPRNGPLGPAVRGSACISAARSTTASRARRSRKYCCRRRSIAGCRRHSKASGSPPGAERRGRQETLIRHTLDPDRREIEPP